MTTLEIILSIVLCVVAGIGIYMINWYREFNDDIMFNWRRDRETVKKLAPNGVFDAILDVDKFNDWFNSDKDKDIYAHPGIFLRRDKLSQHHFEDYIRMTTNGALSFDDFTWKQTQDFEKMVDKDWMKKQGER